MTNKEKLKKVIDNDFNKEKNYLSILERKEGEKSMNKMLKYALVPTLAIIMIVGCVFVVQNNSETLLKNEPATKQDDNKKDKIMINSKSNSDMSGSVKFDGKIDATSEEAKYEYIINKFNLKNIVIPDKYKLNDSYTLYIRENRETKNYNILHDYVLYYKSNDDYYINISISEIGSPIRDYHFDTTGDKESIINGTKLNIAKYGNSYIATFTKDNVNFDIETSGVSEDELINLLKSII